MSEDPHYLRTGSPTDVDIDDLIRDLPLNFQTYVKKEELLCCRDTYDYTIGKLVDRVFWSPQACCSQIIDAIANPEITEKTKSLLQQLRLGRLRLEPFVLVQFWKAIEEIGGRRFLITRDQPFCITLTSMDGFPPFRSEIDNLCNHRLRSLDHKFYVDDEEDLGLIGRVFKHQQLESTPNVGYCSSKEYPHGGKYMENPGCLALPVFELSGCCVGVLEILHYYSSQPFLPAIKDKICRTLEDVGLKCLETCNHWYGLNKDKDEALEGALVEINKVLEVVCRTHDLSLAQTWVLCRLCNAVCTSQSFNSKNSATYSERLDENAFVDACNMYHLRKGQGVVGKALSSHNLVFCKDITHFSITEYPLVHYAGKYGLSGCFAICLRTCTGDDVYVIEFFLPPSKTEGGYLRTTLVSLFATMRQHFRSFKVASGEELGEELSVEVIDFTEDDKVDFFQIPRTASFPDRPRTLKNGGETVWPGSSGQQLMDVEAIHTGNNAVGTTEKSNAAINSLHTRFSVDRLTAKSNIPDEPKTLENGGETVLLDSSDQQFIVADAGNNAVGTAENSNIAITSSQQKCVIKLSRRKHRNAGIQISLEDVRKQSGKKLDDAAESLGVSRSTLKRVCREYEIYWWQPRKRNKDNQSLPNEPVQGATQEQIQDSSQPPISDPPRKKNRAIAAGTKVHFKAVQDTSNVTIKAKYGDDFIKFELPTSAGIEEFQQQVALRLPKLKVGTYSIKYQDDENDWILIACDKDLQDYISYSRSLGKSTVKMVLQPVTN